MVTLKTRPAALYCSILCILVVTAQVQSAAAAQSTISSTQNDGLSWILLCLAAIIAAAGVAAAIYYKNNTQKYSLALSRALAALEKGNTDKIENDNLVRNKLVSSAFAALKENVLLGRETLERVRQERQEAVALADDFKRQVEAAREMAEASRAQGLLSAAKNLEEAISGIDAATEQLQIAAASAGTGAREQQRHIAEAASAMEEMHCSVAEAAQGAESAFEEAEAARDRAKDGAEVVERTVHSIHAVSDKTDSLAKTVLALGEQAQAIGAIMGVISDIADQTNLLALNAAIEAARAGEAGRGFAVVADEVRKLAEKTMAATGEVRKEIETIQSGVGHARTGMDETAELVSAAVNQARESGVALEEIVSMAQATSGKIHAIAAAAQQQSQASEEVTHTITEVSAISDKTGEDMSVAEEAVGNLAARVSDLATLTQVFHLVGEGTVKRVIQELAQSPDILSMNRDRQETALEKSIRRNDFLELLYITDSQGRQTVKNIPRPEETSPDDGKAYGTNWSARPWFTEPAASGTLYVSDVYISEASGENCITVSSPFWDRQGSMLGVIAADVRVAV